MTKFYIVPRGRTLWESLGLLQGSTSQSLDPLGIEDAEILKQKLEKIAFDVVMTSEEDCSRETAEIILAQKEVEFVVDPLLRGRDWGEWESKSVEDLRAQYPVDFAKMSQPSPGMSLEERHKNPFHEAEDFVVFSERLHRSLISMAKEFPGKTVLVVLSRQAIVALFSMISMVVNDLKSDAVLLVAVERGRCRFIQAWKAAVRIHRFDKFLAPEKRDIKK